MSVDLNKLERLAAQATPGPWATEDLYNITHYDEANEWHGIVIQADICGKMIPSEANAAYIVGACNAVPELIARVRELERQRNWLAKFIEDNMDCDQCPYYEEICKPKAPVDCYELISQKAKEAGE